MRICFDPFICPAGIAARDGNTIYFPLSGYRRVVAAGKDLVRNDLKVDRSALRINEQIPDDMFVLQPVEGESVRDLDAEKATGGNPGE